MAPTAPSWGVPVLLVFLGSAACTTLVEAGMPVQHRWDSRAGAWKCSSATGCSGAAKDVMELGAAGKSGSGDRQQCEAIRTTMMETPTACPILMHGRYSLIQYCQCLFRKQMLFRVENSPEDLQRAWDKMVAASKKVPYTKCSKEEKALGCTCAMFPLKRSGLKNLKNTQLKVDKGEMELDVFPEDGANEVIDFGAFGILAAMTGIFTVAGNYLGFVCYDLFKGQGWNDFILGKKKSLADLGKTTRSPVAKAKDLGATDADAVRFFHRRRRSSGKPKTTRRRRFVGGMIAGLKGAATKAFYKAIKKIIKKMPADIRAIADPLVTSFFCKSPGGPRSTIFGKELKTYYACKHGPDGMLQNMKTLKYEKHPANC
jgi:hypothetical protein